ncbi:helix-turn-helix domain-containing protein [Streptomyces noursei]|uniref:helix-turn-helix domain-containing protein n=1 Tax=Streptomyces noursei TaxID=1971 RepID=UPI001676337F|nr:helix-turn-helix transcriptional regulator [Streptomyces noursei]MCZ1017278.1 helix-turn-helix transcriptional regulator [Streptomyces noursei]GGX11995.1 transcriptional regulator [Streptomyces noursei]
MPPRKDPDPSASVQSFYGAELRYRREKAGLTLEQLAEGAFRGISLLSQIERGERGMPMDLAIHVDQKLNTDGFFQRRCEDAAKARRSGHPSYFADIPDLEKQATTIEDWAPFVIPGLMQTRAYMRKLCETAKPWGDPADVEEKARARLKRAEIWKSKERPYYWAILREELIRKPVLPSAGMAEQLEHILNLIHSIRGVLQIVPATTAFHPLMHGLAKVMTFSDAPPLVWIESEFSGQSIDFPPLVTDYRKSYDLLRAAALPPEASLAMVEEAARGYRDEAQQQD